MDCNHKNAKVTDTRQSKRFTFNKQRRLCPDCGERFNTYILTQEELDAISDLDRMQEVYTKINQIKTLMASI